jgi:type VI secretion system protein
MRRDFYSAGERLGRTVVVAAALIAASACMRVGLKPRLTVAVDIAPDANRNEPVAVDLVEIDDKDLAKDAAKMTAADWFQRREQIRQDFPKPKSVSIISWEWVPGQVVPDIKIPMRRPPKAVILFAKYSTPGPHRAKLDPSKPASIQLERDDMKVGVAEKTALAKSLAK